MLARALMNVKVLVVQLHGHSVLNIIASELARRDPNFPVDDNYMVLNRINGQLVTCR